MTTYSTAQKPMSPGPWVESTGYVVDAEDLAIADVLHCAGSDSTPDLRCLASSWEMLNILRELAAGKGPPNQLLDLVERSQKLVTYVVVGSTP